MVKQADHVPYSSKRKKFIEALTAHLVRAGSNSVEMYCGAVFGLGEFSHLLCNHTLIS